jgi:hypothetical protein
VRFSKYALASGGMWKAGSSGQPAAFLAPSTSALPSGAPCALAVPALVGAPMPMVVRATISEGEPRCAIAASMAFRTSSGACPFTFCTKKP